MPEATGRPAPGPAALRLAVLAIAGLTLLRLLLLAADQTGLSTDEAQYWLWGQDLAFGAYSKPPLIGWINRLSTGLLGQSVFAVRAPAALFHAATALIVLALGRRILSPRAAALAAVSYATLPAVALGSWLMTTDTPLLTFTAAALYLHHRIAAGAGRAPGLAALLGLVSGLGLLTKYAMLYPLAGMVLAGTLSPFWRIGRREVALVGGIALLVVAPNLWWVAQNSFATLHHLGASSGVAELGPFTRLGLAAGFLLSQFAVVGPVIFALWLWRVPVALRNLPERQDAMPGLALITLAPVVIVTLQACAGKALANWAVAFAPAAVLLVAPSLIRFRLLAGISLALGLAASLCLPLMAAFGTQVQRGEGKPVLARYLGHEAFGSWVMQVAQARDARTLVAEDRDLLADLSWFTAGTGIDVRALPGAGIPRHHWDLAYPFRPANARPGAVLLVTRAAALPPCATALAPLAEQQMGPGFLGGERLVIIALPAPATCLPRQTERNDG